MAGLGELENKIREEEKLINNFLLVALAQSKHVLYMQASLALSPSSQLLQAMVLDRHAYMAGIADTGARVESPVAVKNGLTHELEADVMMSHITTTVGAMELYAVSPSVPVSAQLGVTWG